MKDAEHASLDRLLDALADEVAQRLQARIGTPDAPPASPPPAAVELGEGSQRGAGSAPVSSTGAAMPEPGDRSAGDLPQEATGPETEADAPAAELPPRYVARFMAQLAVFTLVALVLMNIPFNRQGLTLATALPDSAALVIRDGLVVKPAGSPDIYVYQDGKFRWISSLDAFEHYGYRWQQVREVEAGFLTDYEIGTPLHVLLKCSDSPHIYRLENGIKRWIVDIATFTAEGHVWEDVRMISCQDLRNYPDGETIPPGRGPAPAP